MLIKYASVIVLFLRQPLQIMLAMKALHMVKLPCSGHIKGDRVSFILSMQVIHNNERFCKSIDTSRVIEE